MNSQLVLMNNLKAIHAKVRALNSNLSEYTNLTIHILAKFEYTKFEGQTL